VSIWNDVDPTATQAMWTQLSLAALRWRLCYRRTTRAAALLGNAAAVALRKMNKLRNVDKDHYEIRAGMAHWQRDFQRAETIYINQGT
jgi:hypothetical protein